MISSLLHQLANRFRKTPFHPQWLVNRHHYNKFKKLNDISGCKVLDIGSGNSASKRLLAEKNEVLTTDYPGVSVRYGNAPDIYLDAHQLPFADASFDTVLLFEVLEHLGDHKKVLDEIRRVLKVGGRLYLSVPFIYPEHDAPFDFYRFSSFGLNSILEKSNFRVLKNESIGRAADTIFLMFNLYLLLSCREIERRVGGFSIVVYLIAAPVCALSNILSLIIGRIAPDIKEIYIGRFALAEKI